MGVERAGPEDSLKARPPSSGCRRQREKDLFEYTCSDVEGGGKGINLEKLICGEDLKEGDGDGASGLKETAILEDVSDEDEQNNGLMKSVTMGASASSAVTKDREVFALYVIIER